eukprot:4309532-Karenia_brevis.AAC.1
MAALKLIALGDRPLLRIASSNGATRCHCPQCWIKQGGNTLPLTTLRISLSKAATRCHCTPLLQAEMAALKLITVATASSAAVDEPAALNPTLWSRPSTVLPAAASTRPSMVDLVVVVQLDVVL